MLDKNSTIFKISEKFDFKNDLIPFYVIDKTLKGCHHYVSTHLEKLDHSSLSIGQPDVNETYCFHREGPFWVFYYSEKGMRTGGVLFLELNDAVEFIRLKLATSN